MKKISLPVAILININVILGAGIFVNPRPLTRFVGAFGFLSYIFAALIVLPIVYTISKLASSYPTAGGMYVYPKKYLNPFWGFVSGWGYFLGKTASPALLVHTFVTFFYSRISFLEIAPVLFWDFLFIFFLIFLNIFGVYVGGKIQYLFTTLKSIPILFVVISGFLFFNSNFFNGCGLIHSSYMFRSLPTAMFVLLSFEMVCSIGHMLENPEKNLSRAIFSSFFIVAVIASIFQILIFGLVGSDLSNLSDPISWTTKITNFSALPAILNIFVFGSIIAGAFGSLTTNCWNLYKLGEDKHLPYSNFLIKKNKYDVPWVSLILEGCLACLLLAITSDLVPLQNMMVFGIACSYILNSFSALKIGNGFKKIFYMIAVLSSSYIVFLCFKNLLIYGIDVPFTVIMFIGIIFAFLKKAKPEVE